MSKFQLLETAQADIFINEADDLDTLCEDLEYGDVAEGNYLVVDKTSGIKYKLVADRVVDKGSYYSVPMTSAGTVWRPVLGDKYESK